MRSSASISSGDKAIGGSVVEDIREDSWHQSSANENEHILKVLKDKRRRDLSVIAIYFACIVLAVVFNVIDISFLLTIIFMMLAIFAGYGIIAKGIISIEREVLIRAAKQDNIYLSDVTVINKVIRTGRPYGVYMAVFNAKMINGHSKITPFYVWVSGVEEAGHSYDYYMGVDVVTYAKIKIYDRGYIIRTEGSSLGMGYDYIPCEK